MSVPHQTRIFDMDFSPGKVYIDKMKKIDLKKELTHEENLRWLSEGIFTIEFPDQLWITIDWRPAVEPHGQFVIEVARNSETEDWIVLNHKKCRTLTDLVPILTEFVDYVRQILRRDTSHTHDPGT